MILSLRIKKQYYQRIVNNEKTIEYRLFTKRLSKIIDKKPKLLCLLCGKDHIKIEIKEIELLELNEIIKVYAIHLGEIVK